MYFTVITKGCRTKLNFVAGKCGMRPANSALTLLIMGLRPLKNAQRQSLDPPPRSLPKGYKRSLPSAIAALDSFAAAREQLAAGLPISGVPMSGA